MLLQEWEEKIDRALANRRWTKEDRIRVLAIVAPTLEALLHDAIANTEAATVKEIFEDLEEKRVLVPPAYWQSRWSSAFARSALCNQAVRERLERMLRRISPPQRPHPPMRSNAAHL